MFSQMLVSSAGYIGSMIYGVTLLVVIRKAIAARVVLMASAAVIFLLTMIYGVYKPVASGAALSGIPFTFFAGTLLTLGLVAVAKFANSRLATFFLSFLAVQCVLNALLDLKTVFFLRHLWTEVAERRHQHGKRDRNTRAGLGQRLDHHLYRHPPADDAALCSQQKTVVPTGSSV